ncbi:hypothetical protein FACS1894200_13340 [Spirochaetia bacterium]|nr:hypothetical protein FACS1894200_13340 [Spirochaetia bacterium]
MVIFHTYPLISFNSAFAYNNRGIAYKNKGEYDRAIADYTQAITLDPNYAVAYAGRGIIYDDYKGDYQRAIADYTQALKLDPNNANVKQWLEEARKKLQ